MDSQTKNVHQHKFQWMGIKVNLRQKIKVNELEERSMYISHSEKGGSQAIPRQATAKQVLLGQGPGLPT